LLKKISSLLEFGQTSQLIDLVKKKIQNVILGFRAVFIKLRGKKGVRKGKLIRSLFCGYVKSAIKRNVFLKI